MLYQKQIFLVHFYFSLRLETNFKLKSPYAIYAVCETEIQKEKLFPRSKKERT